MQQKSLIGTFCGLLCLISLPTSRIGQFDDSEYLDTSRALTQASHEALGVHSAQSHWLSILSRVEVRFRSRRFRVGADAFASDLNPVAVLLNKVLLEYIQSTDSNSPMKSGDASED